MPIRKSALRTLFSIFGDAGFANTLGAWEADDRVTVALQSATGCLPVLTSNLVQCHQTGDIAVGVNEVTTAAEGCQNTFLIFPVNPITQATSPFGACTNGTAVGQASTVIGAVNNHATQLAEVMYDNTVGCSIDIEPSIDFQPVSFSRLDGDTNFVWSQGVPFTVQSNGDSCKSNSEKGPIDLGDGWWHTLWNVTAKCRYGDMSPITCSPSNNYRYPREDALVLVSGIVLSSF